MTERTEKEIVEEMAQHAAAITACTAELTRIHRVSASSQKRRKLTAPTEQPSAAVLSAVANKLRGAR